MTRTEPPTKPLPDATLFPIREAAYEAARNEAASIAAVQAEQRAIRRRMQAEDLRDAVRDRLKLELPESAIRWTPRTDGLGDPLPEYEDEPFVAGSLEPRPYAELDGLYYFFSHDRHGYGADLVVHPPCFAHPDRPAADQSHRLSHNQPWIDLGRAYQAFADRTAEPMCGACGAAAYEKAEAMNEERYARERAAEAKPVQDATEALKTALLTVIGEMFEERRRRDGDDD